HLCREDIFRNVTRRWRRSEKREPDLLNRALQFSGPGTFFDHAGAPFSIHSAEIGWKTRRHLRIRTIGNGQTFQQLIKSQLLLLEKRDMFFQRYRQILARTLRGRLSVRPAHRFFATLHWRRTRWREEQPRDDPAKNTAMKIFVVGEIGQHRVSAASAHP